MSTFFVKNTSGNILIMSAIGMTAVIAATSLLMNSVRGYNLQSKMAQAADSASLAGAVHYSYTDDEVAAKKRAQKYYQANMVKQFAALPLDRIYVDAATRKVTVKPTNKLEVRFQDRPSMGIAVNSAAIGDKAEQKTMEVSLVLDVTTSMAKNNKMQGMKDAAKTLISALYENPVNEQYIHIALVPFNTTVRFNGNPGYRNWLNTAHLQRLENTSSAGWSGCTIHNLPPNDASDAPYTDTRLIPYNKDLGENDEKQGNAPLSLALYAPPSPVSPLLKLVQERVSAAPASGGGGGGSSTPPSSGGGSSPPSSGGGSTPPASGGGTAPPPPPSSGGGGGAVPPSGGGSGMPPVPGGGTGGSSLPPTGWSGNSYTLPPSDPWASSGSWGAGGSSGGGVVFEPPQYAAPEEKKLLGQSYSPAPTDYFPPPAPAGNTWAMPSWDAPPTAPTGGSSGAPVNPVTLATLPDEAGCDLPSIVPLTNDKSGLLALIDSFSNNGYGNAQLGLSGTVPGVGMLWGWRTLSPRWKGLWPDGAVDTPADNGQTVKTIVFLTDGLGEMPGILGTTIGYGAFGYPNGALGKHAGYTWDKYGINAQTFEDADLALDDKWRSVCSAIKQAAGINVYTIGFDVLGQPGGETRAKKLLEYCASAASNVYMAANNAELKDAFEEIANSLLNDPKVKIVE